MPSPTSPTLATLDIGTNTVLLLVASWDGKNLNVLKEEARITRLGEGLHASPYFLPAAQERLLACLRTYAKIAKEAGAEKILAVGTAGFRKAKNAYSFVERIREETGIDVRIIDGNEEARLSYLSADHDFGETAENLFVLDIGGGSTEIISKTGGVSLDLGAVVLAEKNVSHDPITDEEFEALTNKIRKTLADTSDFPRVDPNNRPTLVSLAGSVTTLSAIKQGLTEWDGSKVQGSILTLQDVVSFIKLFRPKTNEERKKIPGMVAGREDTVLIGTLILEAIMKRLGVLETTVSDRGLRYGLIYEQKI